MKKRYLIIGFCAAVMLLQSMTVFAAPKQMSDGTFFDAVYYANTYPDVKAVFGTNEQNLFTHYKLFGKKEGRNPVPPTQYQTPLTPSVSNIMQNGFDPVFYANHNPDVVAVFGKDPQLLYQHYILFGKNEGRKPHSVYDTTSTGTASTGTATTGTTSSGTDVYQFGLDKTQYDRVIQRVDDNSGKAKTLVSKLNDYRSGNDKKKVYRDDSLSQAATLLAMEMDDNNKASSKRPNGNSYSTVYSQFGIGDYDYHGMVYQKNSSSDTDDLLDAWKNDSDDNSELLDKHYKYVGVGRSNKYWVLLFTD